MPAKLGYYTDQQEQLLQPQVLLSVVYPADIKYKEVLNSNDINFIMLLYILSLFCHLYIHA